MIFIYIYIFCKPSTPHPLFENFCATLLEYSHVFTVQESLKYVHDFTHRLLSYLPFILFFLFCHILQGTAATLLFQIFGKSNKIEKGLKIGYRCIIEVLFNLFKGTQVKNPIVYYPVDLFSLQIPLQVRTTELVVSEIYCVPGLCRSGPVPFNLLCLTT